jgi:hypothetical protein
MGTPVTCAYATLTFGHHENTVLLPTFSNNLLFYRHYIDDIFGTWLPSPGDASTWENFKRTLNNWGKLEWTVEEPSTHTHFLDLNITIKNSSIIFSTNQKPLNLYFYIPPSSAHPTSCLKGLIKGEPQWYWLQNQRQDFEELVIKFIERLHTRGHSIKDLNQIFLQAAESLGTTQRNKQNNTQNNALNTTNDNTLYIHWTYHPKDLQHQDIRHLYNNILQPHIPQNRMVIAVSRPKNLRDVLTKTELKLPKNIKLQNLITSNNLTNP